MFSATVRRRHHREFLEHRRDRRLRARAIGLGQHDRLAASQDRAAVGLIGAGQHLDERRLAAAVLAHKPVDLAGIQRERHAVVGDDAGKALGDLAKLPERGRRHRVGLTVSRRIAAGRRRPSRLPNQRSVGLGRLRIELVGLLAGTGTTLSLSTIVVGVSTKPPANLPFSASIVTWKRDLAHDEGRRVDGRGHVPSAICSRPAVSPSLPSSLRSACRATSPPAPRP